MVLSSSGLVRSSGTVSQPQVTSRPAGGLNSQSASSNSAVVVTAVAVGSRVAVGYSVDSMVGSSVGTSATGTAVFVAAGTGVASSALQADKTNNASKAIKKARPRVGRFNRFMFYSLFA
jgi:hypothetical protein